MHPKSSWVNERSSQYLIHLVILSNSQPCNQFLPIEKKTTKILKQNKIYIKNCIGPEWGLNPRPAVYMTAVIEQLSCKQQVVGSNPPQAQCNFSSEELHWVSHGVAGRKCQCFTSLLIHIYLYIYSNIANQSNYKKC